MRLLASAHILELERGHRKNVYRIRNEYMLDYISQRERNTFTFLSCYFEKVLSDSGIWRHFLEYKENPTRESYLILRDRFIRFMIGNTAINTDVEARRIFPKILNVLAVDNQIPGSERGSISKYVYTFADLMYNRKNWRDLNKDKSITRQEAVEDNEEVKQQEAYNTYYVQKAIAHLRKIQKESEVHDQWGQGDATQVHHIFPKINKEYQLTCLLAKADTIDYSLKKFGERYYRKESFLYVIKVGLSQEQEWPMTMSFADIKHQLILAYNE